MADEPQELRAAIREAAADYFETRDRLDASKDVMVELMVTAKEEGGYTQQEIADMCDLRSIGTEKWTFHRSRVQQFLGEAKQSAA